MSAIDPETGELCGRYYWYRDDSVRYVDAEGLVQ